jgi:hypothetical protein
LAVFEAKRETLAAEGVRVIAASTDGKDKAAGTASEHSLGFPVGYGLPVLETAAALGAFYDEGRGILHATEYVLRPGGVIAAALYSSGPIGRLVPDDVLGLIRFYKQRG